MKINFVSLILAVIAPIAALAETSFNDFASGILCLNGRTERYNHPIKVFVITENLKFREIIGEIVDGYNKICAGLPIKAQIVPFKGNANCVIEIKRHIKGIDSSKFKKEVFLGAIARTYQSVDLVRNINPDYLPDDHDKMVLWRCFLGSIGFLCVDSTYNGKSIWSNGSNSLEPTEEDKRIIRLYQKIPSNTTIEKVRLIVHSEFQSSK